MRLSPPRPPPPRAADSVTSTVLDLGYAGPAAFTAMFTRATGLAPGRYVAGGLRPDAASSSIAAAAAASAAKAPRSPTSVTIADTAGGPSRKPP